MKGLGRRCRHHEGGKPRGKVYGLKDPGHLDGNYTAVGAGATVAGAAACSMRNQNGVTIDLVATTQGLKVTLGGGVSI